MFQVVLIGAASSALVGAVVVQHRRARDEREQESLGAKALYEEMDAALRSVNMAARNADSRWADGLCESRTLMETWLAHGPAFEKRLDLARWEILNEAVRAVEPRDGLRLVAAGQYRLEPSLGERQERLQRGIDVLREVLTAR